MHLKLYKCRLIFSKANADETPQTQCYSAIACQCSYESHLGFVPTLTSLTMNHRTSLILSDCMPMFIRISPRFRSYVNRLTMNQPKGRVLRWPQQAPYTSRSQAIVIGVAGHCPAVSRGAGWQRMACLVGQPALTGYAVMGARSVTHRLHANVHTNLT